MKLPKDGVRTLTTEETEQVSGGFRAPPPQSPADRFNYNVADHLKHAPAPVKVPTS